MNGFLSRVLKAPHEPQIDYTVVEQRQQVCKDLHERMIRSKQVFSGILSLFPEGKPGSKVIEIEEGRVAFNHITPQVIEGSLVSGKQRTHLSMVDAKKVTTVTLHESTEGLTVVKFHEEDDNSLKVTVTDTNTPPTSEECKKRIDRIESLAALFGEVALGPVA